MIGRIHLPLFLLALTIALVIKVAVSEDDEITEKTVEARVTYTHPEDVMVLERVKEVELRLRGSRSDIDQLNPINVEVSAEIGPNQIGNVPVVLQRSNVRIPNEIDVVAIQPNTFTVEVEPLRTAMLPVRVELIGEPVGGARPGDPTVIPGWAEARGPASVINDLTHLTASVSIERKGVTFDTTVPLVSENAYVEVQPARARVTVPMSEPELSQPVGQLIDEGERRPATDPPAEGSAGREDS